MLEAATGLAAALLTQLLVQLQMLGLGLLAVWPLRPVLRRMGGARAQVLAWAVVPAVALAGLVPAGWVPAVGGLHAASQALLASAGQAIGLQGAVAPAAAGCVAVGPASGWAVCVPAPLVLPVLLPLAAAWLLGLLVLMAVHAARQQVAQGPLQRRPGECFDRLPAGRSPALIGAFRPRLALPRDFEQRFDAAERRAVLAHEAAHLRRHDNRWNLLALVLTLLQWFNPVAWWALRRYRADQELACDAEALGEGSADTRLAFQRALLKSDALTAPLAAPRAAVASSWRGTHPLLERLAGVQAPLPSATRRRAGAALALAVGGGFLTVALALKAQPEAAAGSTDTVMLYLTVEHNGRRMAAPRLFGKLGEMMAVEMRPAAAALSSAGTAPAWKLHITPSAEGAGLMRLQMLLSGGVPLQRWAEPTLVAAEGDKARFEATSPSGLHRLGVSVVARRAAAPDTAPKPP